MYPAAVLIVILLVSSTNGGICPHCGKYFESVGRHIWRCQSNPGTSATGQSPRPPLSTPLEASQLCAPTPSMEIPPAMGTPCTSRGTRRSKPRGDRAPTVTSPAAEHSGLSQHAPPPPPPPPPPRAPPPPPQPAHLPPPP